MFACVAVSLCKIPSLRRSATPVDSVRLPLIKRADLEKKLCELSFYPKLNF